MNTTITVKMTRVLFFLCSGFFHFTMASNRLRLFNFKESGLSWNAALSECNETNETLVTLYDEEDAKFTANFTANFSKQQIWLGLRKRRNITWSDGTPYLFRNFSVNVTSGEQRCVATDGQKWSNFSCSERKHFMCYHGTKYILIENEKNWCQALQHCRKYYTDLVSITNQTQNERVIKMKNDTSFWIGLMHDEWEWADKSCSSFRKWDTDNNHPKDNNDCTKQNGDNDKGLFSLECVVNQNKPLCSQGTVRIKVIKQRLNWEKAYDYCKAYHTRLLWIQDSKDEEAVGQWLNHTDVTGPFWIGLRQSRVFGFWIWTSDRIVTNNNWENGTQPELPLSNHCGVIKNNFKWSDENCLFQLPFLCEEEIVYMNK